MRDGLMLVLAYSPLLLLIAGACAVATWALRLPDAQSQLVSRLTRQADVASTKAKPGSKGVSGNGE